jgi:mRNA-degrading endonuclease toxin of MazEF toxin-antitoxin module
MSRRPPSQWYPKRGEVYAVQVDTKARPAVIISVDALNRHSLDVCLIPFTTQLHAKFSMRVELNPGDGGVHRDCWAKCDQMNTLEKSFLVYPPLGTLSAATMRKIEDQVRIALGL